MPDKKHTCCEHHQGGNGFMVGAVLGGALALLVSTKKGRAILRELSEKGLDALEEVKDLQGIEQLKELVTRDDPAVSPTPEEARGESEPVSTTIEESVTVEHHTEPAHHTTESPKSSTGVRRFFRGVKKK